MSEIMEGQIWTPDYPMVWAEYTVYSDEGPFVRKTWSPGVRWEFTDPFGGSDAFADGVGKQILTVVSVHKPGKYPERVFYTRKWQDPSGKVFGKPGLRITTTQNFRILAKGYRHSFQLKQEAA